MSRKPIYHENKRYRFVSIANGLWQAQRKDGEGGTRESDCWTPLCKPTTKAAAEAHMNESAKHEQGEK